MLSISLLNSDTAELQYLKSIDQPAAISQFSFSYLLSIYNELKRRDYLRSCGFLFHLIFKRAKILQEFNDAAHFLNTEILHHPTDEAALLYLKNFILTALTDEGSSKKTILFHLYGWLYGGAERTVSIIASYLSYKHHVFIIVFIPSINTSYELSPYIRFIEIQGMQQREQRLLMLIRALNADLFIGNNNNFPPLTALYPILQADGIKTIALNHENFFFPYGRPALITNPDQKLKELSTATVSLFITQFSANAYRLYHPNAAFIPNPLSYQVPQSYHFNPNGKTILAVGRFDDPIKRLDRILTIFSLVLKHIPDAKLMVVGPYDLSSHIPEESPQSLQMLMSDLKLDDSQVSFAGLQKNVIPFYQSSDLMLMTSDDEGFGLVLTEAMSFGLPCFIFDIPGLEDIVINDFNGYRFPQDDSSSLSLRIAELLSYIYLRSQLSQNAYRFSQNFSLTQIGPKWELLLDIIFSSNDQSQINALLNQHFIQDLKAQPALLSLIKSEYIKHTGSFPFPY